MENRVNDLAREVIEATKMEASFYNRKPELKGFLIELDVVLSGLMYENAATEGMINTLVRKAVRTLDSDFYNEIYPQMQMDMNGNYTTNSKLWV